MSRRRPAIRLDRDEVASRAYLHWQRRGCPVGDAERDWFDAEQELLREALEAPSRPEDEGSAAARAMLSNRP